jgi:hypothetical protein
MPTSNRLVFPLSLTSDSVTSRTAVYGPVRTVVWQGSVGDRRPYADQVTISEVKKDVWVSCGLFGYTETQEHHPTVDTFRYVRLSVRI